MIDEGVIKFNCDWNDEQLPVQVPDELKMWRDKMHQLKLIGEYTDIKIGYGNISIKTNEGILISGTQTGNIYPIQENDFALVTSYSIKHNQVTCKGEVKASAESLTHAAVYECDDSIKAIIHVHNKELWDKLIGKVPTSNRSVPYGTAKMALEIKRLFDGTNLAQEKIMVMGGHEEGIITFGKNLKQAGQLILNYAT
ncbi:MAG: rRNA adenine methyltransferase [Flavobacteriales bacterium]|nr:MAG: rRNA adenine methyltransferase [Flavobacteriales bacterium]